MVRQQIDLEFFQSICDTELFIGFLQVIDFANLHMFTIAQLHITIHAVIVNRYKALILLSMKSWQ